MHDHESARDLRRAESVGFESQESRLDDAHLESVLQLGQASEALRQSYEELQAIYDGMEEGLIICDAETTGLHRVNRAMCRLLGYTEEEMKRVPPATLHPPELLPAMMSKYEQMVLGSASHVEDIPFVRKDGRIVYLDVRSARIQYNGRPCLISIFHDVTERKRIHERLEREHRALKHLLQSSDHERQLIAYEIHDGLAQQLAGAIMQFQVYAHQKDANPELAAKAHQSGVAMLRQGHVEARRLIAGVRPPILDESGILAAVSHLVNEKNDSKGVKIEHRIRVVFDRLAPILENAIFRIIQEGLTNACVHSKSDRVRISLVQCGDRLQIKIRDWGVGFDVSSMPKNRFGLEGIRQRVRLLGGKCRIRSKAGKGSRISIELPVVARE